LELVPVRAVVGGGVVVAAVVAVGGGVNGGGGEENVGCERLVAVKITFSFSSPQTGPSFPASMPGSTKPSVFFSRVANALI
jgi:hypothetical protein